MATTLGPDVRNALIESLFDHKSKAWFGPAMAPPQPPAWASLDDRPLEVVLAISAELSSGPPLGSEQASAVKRTAEEIEAILERRRP